METFQRLLLVVTPSDALALAFFCAAWFGYGFVGFAGVQKMSSSAGGAPTAEDALKVLEPGILRWLYVRRNPRQTFNIDFGPEVVRLYDEWDALGRRTVVAAARSYASTWTSRFEGSAAFRPSASHSS